MRNEYIRGTVKVVEASKKVQGSRLRWYGNVMRRNEEYVCRKMMRMIPLRKRWRGRMKKRWSDCVEKDMKDKGVDKDWGKRLTQMVEQDLCQRPHLKWANNTAE